MSGWLCGCTANPHPLDGCPGVPKAEAQPITPKCPEAQAEAEPSTKDLPPEVYDNAINTFFNASDGDRVSAAFAYVFAAGRAQAAADIRAAARIEYGVEHTYPGQEPIGLPAVNRWAAKRAAAQSGGVATRRLVERTTWSTPWREAAERDEDSRTDVDEPTLLVGTGVPDPRAETEDGGAQ